MGVVILATYDRHVWKLLNPSLVLDGRWVMHATFNYGYGAKGEAPVLPGPISGNVEFRQTALSLRMVQAAMYPPKDANDVIAHSSGAACQFSDDGTEIHFAYVVNRSNRSNPEITAQHGYERMIVGGRDRKGRPTRRRADFFQCVHRGGVAYLGEAIFERKDPDRYVPPLVP